MKKTAIFIPYFAEPDKGFPNYFEYWQRSAAANTEIQFFLPTNIDVSLYRKYPNIHFLVMDAEDFFQKVERIAGCQVVRSYYKIGEFRPLCALLFPEIVGAFEYWGYSELDLIYGDIFKFIKPYMEQKAPVIGRLGHFRLVKNTQALKAVPFYDTGGLLTMQDAYNAEKCCHFDEVQGMGVRYHMAGIPVADISAVIADIDQKWRYFRICGKKGKWAFQWNNGCLSGYTTSGKKEEYLYIHLQKRKMEITSDGKEEDGFYIFPNQFSDRRPSAGQINVSTISYTLSNRIKYYRNCQKNEDEKLEGIIRETHLYCCKNGLFL